MKRKMKKLISNYRIQVRRDIKHRILYDIYERERRILKSVVKNEKETLKTRLKAQNILSELGGKPTKIKNRCILTSRSRSVYRYFKLTRHSIKELAGLGILSGVIKSSW